MPSLRVDELDAGSMMAARRMLVVLCISALFLPETRSNRGPQKECPGTSYAHSSSGNANEQYLNYVKKYSGCTKITGNLEIVGLFSLDDSQNAPFDLNFLRTIQEVEGYVLIARNHVDVIPLTSLRVIHGHPRLFQRNRRPSDDPSTQLGLSLFVNSNVRPNSSTVGLKELQLNSLYEIPKGSVEFYGNNLLCLQKGLVWDDILSNDEEEQTITIGYLPSSYKRPCEERCDEDRGNCTSIGEHLAVINRTTCHQSCYKRQCFGPERSQCCDKECAGGCFETGSEECFTCRHYLDGKECVKRCPDLMITDPTLHKRVPNPGGKYAYMKKCLDQCSAGMKIEAGSCVSSCSEGYYEELKGTCIECNHVCPRQDIECKGGMMNITNYQNFNRCEVVTEDLKLVTYNFHAHRALTLEHLSFLESVKEIRGILFIQGARGIDSLSFLKNLKYIRGIPFPDSPTGKALLIDNTSLKSLDLTSLEEVHGGDIVITRNTQLEELNLISLRRVSGHMNISKNQKLCYVNSLANFTRLFTSNNFTSEKFLFNIKSIASSDYCENRTCSDQCNSDGCWGKGNDQCVTCKNARLENKTCLTSCDMNTGFYADLTTVNSSEAMVCKPCHPECLGGCTGEGEDKCSRCRNVKIGQSCSTKCGNMFFVNEDGVCTACHDNCLPVDGPGCSGPASHLGPGGCNKCFEYQDSLDDDITAYCLKGSLDDDMPCPTDYSWDYKMHLYNVTNNKTVKARRRCKLSSIDPRIEAVTNMNDESNYVIIYVLVAVGVAVLGAIVLLVVVQKSKDVAKKNRIQRQEAFLRMDSIPGSPSGLKPDMSILRLINESELRRGVAIGSGAFGTVYKGLWLPPGANVKIHVAVKVVQDSFNSPAKVELLDEARIMAAVNNERCVRLLGVCMTAEMMLITQLMPLGSLLDYVRKHRNNISSTALLTWSKQIAEGMAHLEFMNIVHRDLAARNVLVEAPDRVRITDFGLAKMLDNQDEFQSTGGKVPIKWLALESIEHHIYTHKSDVWSYGVTLWELFTYGEKPFEHVRAKDVCEVLEMGERLAQPPICTLDVYMVMIKCWMIEAECRPYFTELVNVFMQFLQDPARYLVIQGDEAMHLPVVDFDDKILSIGVSIDEPDLRIVTAEDYLSPEDQLMERAVMQTKGNDYQNNFNKPKPAARHHHDRLSSQAECEALIEQEAEFQRSIMKNVRIDLPPDPHVERTMSIRYAPNPSRDVTSFPELVRQSLLKSDLRDKNGNKMAVVTDENDYLEPMSSAKPSQYIDIVRNCEDIMKDDENSYILQSQADYINEGLESCPVRPMFQRAESQCNPEYYGT